MAFNLKRAHNYFCIADFYGVDRAYGLWIAVSDTGCPFQKNWKTPALLGMITKCLMTIGMVLFLLQPVLATEDQGNYETSAFAALSQDPVATVGPSHLLATLVLAEEESISAVNPEPSGSSESTTETLTSDSTAFQSIHTLLTSSKTAMHKPTLVQSPTSPITPNNGSQTTRWPSEVSTEDSASLTSKDAAAVTSASTSSSGLTTSTMHSALSPNQSVPYTDSTIPSLSISTETSSISKEPTSGSSPSTSSLTTTSLHLTQTSANTIALTQSTVKPTEVPFTAETLASLGPSSGTTKLVTLSDSVYSTSNGITVPNETSQGTEANTHTAETTMSTSSFMTTVQTTNKDIPVTHPTSVVPSVATEYILSTFSDYSTIGSAETSKPTTLTSTGFPAVMTTSQVNQNETNQTTNDVFTADSRTTVLSLSPSVTTEYPTPASVTTSSLNTHVSSRITTTTVSQTTKEVTGHFSSQTTLLYSTKPTVSTSLPTSTSAGFITVDETSTVSDSQQTTVSNSVTSSTGLTVSVNGSLPSPTTVKDKTTSLTSAFPTMGSTVPSSTEDTTSGPLPTKNGTSIVSTRQSTVSSFVSVSETAFTLSTIKPEDTTEVTISQTHTTGPPLFSTMTPAHTSTTELTSPTVFSTEHMTNLLSTPESTVSSSFTTRVTEDTSTESQTTVPVVTSTIQELSTLTGPTENITIPSTSSLPNLPSPVASSASTGATSAQSTASVNVSFSTASPTTKVATDRTTIFYSSSPIVSTSSTFTSEGLITGDKTSTVSDSQQTTSDGVTSSTSVSMSDTTSGSVTERNTNAFTSEVATVWYTTDSINGSSNPSPTTVTDKTSTATEVSSFTSAFPTMASTVPSSTEDTTSGPLPTENGTSIVTGTQTTVSSMVTTNTTSGSSDFTSAVHSSVEPTSTGSLTEFTNWSSTLPTTSPTELTSTVSSSVTSCSLTSPGNSSMEPTSVPYTGTESGNGSTTLATTDWLSRSTEVSTTKPEDTTEVSTFQTSTEPALSSTITSANASPTANVNTSAITDATAMVNSSSTPDISVSSTEDTSSKSELTSTVSPVTTPQGLTTMVTPTENQTTNTQTTLSSSVSVNSSSTTESVGSTASMTTLEVNPNETTPDQTTIYLSSTTSNINMTTSSSTESPTTLLTPFSSPIPSSESTETATSETTSTTERTTFMLSSPSASPEVSTFQTHFTEPPLSSSMTPSHTSPTEIPSTVFPTANVTHSVITEEMTTGNIASTSGSTVSSSLTTVATEGTSLESVTTTTVPSLTSTTITVNTTTADTVETTSTQLTPASTTHTTHVTVTNVTTPYTPTTTLATPTTAMASTTQTGTPPISTTQLVTDTETVVTSGGTSVAPETTETSSSPSVTITAALTSMITMSSQTTRDTASTVQSTTRPPSTTTVKPPLECKITERIWVKTVLSLKLRRNRVDDALKQNLRTGLTQALQNAFNNSAVHAQIESLTGTTNVTVGYYATNGRIVYISAVVIKVLTDYGDLMSDIKQHVTNVQSLPIPVAPWIPTPALWMQLKTVLRFVGANDNIQSCNFVQTMEQRLQNAFAEAESKVLNANNNLTVQILNTSQSAESPAVTLIYVVWNQTVMLNGTVSSSLLNQLTAELVGYYLFFPPLIIAEPLKYNNLDTSPSTKDYWVTTVIQDVGNSSLNGNYQSFASLMEQRLAELLVIAQQQGRRFRRATTVGSYTVQMVEMKRVEGAKNPVALTYYVLQNGTPLLGTTTAKILNTIDSQTMALTLGYFVQLQAEPVVKNPPNNLWIIAAVLAPIAVVTVIIIIITAVLCRKNKNDFKSDTMANMHQRAKPVQGFDYAKQHLGQQGGEEEETSPVTQETGVLPLPVRDAPLSQERGISQDGSTTKTTMTSEISKSRLPSGDSSVISNASGKPNTGRISPQKMTTQQKMKKEESRKKNGLRSKNRIVPMSDEEDGAVLFDRVSRSSPDPYDTSSGSLQLIAIKPLAAPPSNSHPDSDRSQDSAVINGEVNKALKQKSDIEHYRNKLRLKAKRKGYYDFPALDGNSKSLPQKQRHMYEKAQMELDKVLDPDEDMSSTYVKSKNRQSHMKSPAYRSKQSLNSPSPGGTEMDLLVTRERPRRGIRNSGYDTEPELIVETNVDHVAGPRGYTRGRQVKGHSETSTLSSQPSIDEVRQQMHLLLEEAFSLASAGQATTNRQQGQYNPVQQLPFSEVVTSAPGTMNRPRGAVQWVPAYSSDLYQYSLPRPAFRFSQLSDMAMGSPPPPVPPRSGPAAVTSLRRFFPVRSTSDIGTKTRTSEPIGPEHQSQHDAAPFVPVTRAASVDQPVSNYSGNPAPAVYAIPANRPGYSGYFIPTPPTPYRSQTWMPYPAEGNVPSQWAEAVPLPGYVEAYPHSRYQQNSPPRLPRQCNQASSLHPTLDQALTPSTTASQQSLTENDASDTSLTNISTAALVKAIREEVAKLAKKQTDMFEFQV
ncbi:UPF0606 protein KIAA1549L-like isoform X5 [Acipenser ruthenus]|uniref:UPF0606 protein KIAA1549L-like isoform X5 n=1 Tax=Acipenser ruthenus TaxID=7906 RepID=UPI002740F073|nr:UPF0606 protein KIAA1549L-like isoform X5 [Acipenser ruthenus]